MRLRSAWVRVLTVLVSWLAPATAQAAWSRYPDVNLPIATATANQIYPSILEDGVGGAFIAWHDNRGPNYDIYVQRVSAGGIPQWTTNGVAVCAATGDQANAQMVPDGAGGVIVVWHDFRAGNWDVYVQRLNASGVPQWTANGVALCTAAGDQPDPVLVSDGSGGAIVAWADHRSGTRWDVYARRVNAAGSPQWLANGVVLCDAVNNTQEKVRIASDGAGGAIVTWHDARTGGASVDIWAQRVNGSGVSLWPLNGALITGAISSQTDPTIASDGAGGAFIAWGDLSVGLGDIKMQRVGPTGAMLWPAGGVAVCAAFGAQDMPEVIGDGTGGAIVTWQDFRASENVYAQRVNSAGAMLWTSNGTPVGVVTYAQADPHLVSDGAGGAIITYRVIVNGTANGDLRAQRIAAGGSITWPSEGVLLASAINSQWWPRIVADGAGGAIISFHDDRNGPSYDVYAQRVDRYGYLGNIEPVVTSVSDVPNDQGGKVNVSWTASPLDVEPSYGISDYRLWRSVPETAVFTFDRRPARATSRDPDVAAAGDALLLTSSAGATYAWEMVFFQAAAGLPSYSLTTSTTGDSTPAANPLTVFMVEARGGSTAGAPRWFSAPNSGYSVDDLAPAAPSALTGAYANGTTALHWGANGEADLSSYRLYRGTSAGFTPSAWNRIASPTHNSFDDPAGTPAYYKLSAVDIHGNESGFALLMPSGTLDAPVTGSPVALRLGVPGPNPAASRARIAFDVPREQRLSLIVYDAGGRAVRVLFRGSHPAGSFSSTWDLRDDAGRAVADGVYFVSLDAQARALTQRMVVMR